MSEADDHRAFSLSSEQVEFFHANGYIGPFEVYTPDEAGALLTAIRCQAHDRSKAIFGDSALNYDRHLDIDELSQHVLQRRIVDRVACLLGPDLLCWRTEFFSKKRGQAPTGWHQVESYMVGGSPMLEVTERQPGMPTEMTAWTSLTEATREMSCLRFVRGSHTRWYFDETGTLTFRPGTEHTESGSFFGYRYDELKLDPDWMPDESDIVSVETKPGECILFTAKLVHGSMPHTVRKARVGLAARYVPTSVRVYPKTASFTEFGETLSTEHHGNVLVSGTDRFGHNRIVEQNARGMPFRPLIEEAERGAD